MKHINTYKLFEAAKESREINLADLVNRDMIADLKDLSLEVIDRGYSLLISIFLKNVNPIGSVEIDHRNEDYVLYHEYDNFEDLIILRIEKEDLNAKLKYKFCFYKENTDRNDENNYGQSTYCCDSNDEILERICSMYPEENIEIDDD